jgi:protocatechuate 3,4-dioxygenase beta subunit
MKMQMNENCGRRDFIKRSSLFAIAVTLPVLGSCEDEKNRISPCITTSPDILGPYYKPGSPFQENIIPVGNSAPLLQLEGKISSACASPIKDSIIEIWNADENGAYDASSNFAFRGSYRTLEDGFYKFKTIIPGRYLNGNLYRPSHIHLRITAPGHQELVSQIYFKDDPFIETDPWASSAQAVQRILTVTKDGGGTDTINFDISLNLL